MKKPTLFGIVTAVLMGGIAIAQEALGRATPENSAQELIAIAQQSVRDEDEMIRRWVEREAQEYKNLAAAIEKELRTADDVMGVRMTYPEIDHARTGTVYRFSYLGRPVWVMFVEKDEHEGLAGQRLLWFKAAGRAAKDNDEEQLLAIAPQVFNNEMGRDLPQELRRRFGYENGNVGVVNSFMMVKSELAPNVKGKVAEVLEKCRNIGDAYREAQQKPEKQ